jgi:Flp pilus assembly protein TadG
MTGLSSLPARLRRDLKSVAALEFSLIAPVLILLGLGSVEFAAAIRVELGADHASRAVASLISQTPIPTTAAGACQSTTTACLTAAALQDIFIAGQDSNEGFAATLTVAAASVNFTVAANGASTSTIGWDAATAGTAPAYAAAPANATTLATGLGDGVDNDSVIIVQTKTTFTLPFLPGFFGKLSSGPFTFTSTSFARPRYSLVISKGW